MEFVAVKNSEINENLFRLDAEHHVGIQKIDIEKLRGDKLGDLCSKVVQGPNPKFLESGVPSLNGKNIYFGTLDSGEPNYISEDEYKSLKAYQLKKNDILITLKHASRVGRLWVYRKNDDCLFSRNLGLIRVKANARINVETLLLYLWGSQQQQLLNLIATGGTNGQITLSMAELREFPIPNFSDAFQTIIKNIFRESEFLTESSIATYEVAEKICLSELGLVNCQPKHQLTFVKNYSQTCEAERIDAEYYQPKYEEIEQALKGYSGGYSTVGEEFKQNKSTFKIVEEEVYQYVEIGSVNVLNGEITSNKVLGRELPANAKRALRKNDLIVSKVRTYRGAITIIEESGYVGSGAFTVLRENGRVNKETLFTLLHSKPLLAWSLKPNTGTSYPVIVDNDILTLPIPLISELKQAEIKKKITESFNLRKQSKHHLECAKKAVEIAIEKTEKSAIEWLEKQLEVQ